MAKRAEWFMVRLAVCLVVVWVGFNLVVVGPRQKADEVITSVKSDVNLLQTTIDNAREVIKGLPAPNQIMPRTPGSAKGYVRKLEPFLPTLNVQPVAAPNLPLILFPDGKVKSYQLIAADQAFGQVLETANQSVTKANNFYTHHYAVMKALAKVLEYNPVKEARGRSPESLQPAWEAAAAGLVAAVRKLATAPRYDDPTLEQLVKLLATTKKSAERCLGVLSSGGDTGPAQAAYISNTRQLQAAILTNRQAAWQAHLPPLVESLTSASKLLRPYTTKINSL